MKKTVTILLSCLILLSALSILTAAEETAAPTPVYYPNGTVYLNEAMIAAMTAEQLADAFKAGFGDATPVWNAESGKLELHGTTNSFVDIHALDQTLVMEHYTISADLCVKDTTFSGKVLMGMGINSASADGWNHGFYWQCNFQSTQTGDVEIYVNNYNTSSQNVNGGGSSTKKIYSANGYKIGETVIHVDIKVGTELVQVLYDNEVYFTIEKNKLTYPVGLPFFMLRGNTTLAIDNLLIYSGTGDPDPEKTTSNTQPISAPEVPTDEETTTSAPETTTAPTTTSKPETTSAPTTTAAPTATSAPETTNEPGSAAETETKAAAEKGGCGSSIGVGLLSVVLICGCGAAFCGKKKH